MVEKIRKLNSQQQDILIALFKFRFATKELIENYLPNQSQSYSYFRIRRLVDLGYVDKRYDGEMRISHKPVIYYLNARGIKTLKENKQLGISNKALDLMYKNAGLSQGFIDKCLDDFRLYLKFNKLYKGKLEYFSQYELMEFDFFPKHKPNGYMILNPKQYFVIRVSSLTDNYAAIKGRIGSLIKHLDSNKWRGADKALPVVLYVTSNSYLERQVGGLIKSQLKKYDVDDLSFLTTTEKAFYGAIDKDAEIWTDPYEPRESQKIVA